MGNSPVTPVTENCRSGYTQTDELETTYWFNQYELADLLPNCTCNTLEQAPVCTEGANLCVAMNVSGSSSSSSSSSSSNILPAFFTSLDNCQSYCNYMAEWSQTPPNPDIVMIPACDANWTSQYVNGNPIE